VAGALAPLAVACCLCNEKPCRDEAKVHARRGKDRKTVATALIMLRSFCTVESLVDLLSIYLYVCMSVCLSVRPSVFAFPSLSTSFELSIKLSISLPAGSQLSPPAGRALASTPHLADSGDELQVLAKILRVVEGELQSQLLLVDVAAARKKGTGEYGRCTR
jgi:hypothetical protein